MFRKILIANRGEIAIRVIRACRELGISTVAVCSEADRTALHAQIADETVCIGPAPSKDSYLNMNAILSACNITGAEAIHPGFGFLSENASFARMCARCGVTFIGPSPDAIEQMGDKSQAKKTMREAGIPVVPGSEGELSSLEQARRLAQEIGYPVMLKASAGGGGRGIRRVNREEELEDAYLSAQKEALSFFADGSLYLEKFIENPRHIEIQVLADQYGNTVHLGERDCSLQRRNQKLLEEAPSPMPTMNDRLRQEMGQTAIRAAQAAGYRNAGTVEFLVDRHDRFYFMEMNTRIQVEHPITELITGIDLVKQQILLAAGKPLGVSQKDIHFSGHAIECRINAENPAQNFRPCPGKITSLYMPGGPGVRIDSAMYAGYTIPSYYDSMIAKLITYAPTRREAIRKMQWALAEFLVEGVDTNIDFQLSLLRNEHFLAGEYDNGFIARGRL